jgi:hypothetical protein
VRATKGIKIEDPFTRRSTKPRMNFKPSEKQDDDEPTQMVGLINIFDLNLFKIYFI